MANTINIGVQAQTSEANKSLKSLEKIIDDLISELKKLNGSLDGVEESSDNMSNGVDEASDSLKKMGKSAKNAEEGAKSLSDRLKSISNITAGILGAAGISAGIDKLFDTFKTAATSAIDLESSLVAIEQTYAGNSYAVREWANNNAAAFGLSISAATSYYNRFQSVLSNVGLSSKEAFTISKNAIQLVGDISFAEAGVEADQAFEAIRDFITKGEGQLDDLGISIDAAAVATAMLGEGQEDYYNSLSEADKLLLRYNYLMQNTTGYQGIFTDSLETGAAKIQTLGIVWENFLTTLGEVGLPLIKWALNGLLTLVGYADAVLRELAELYGWEIDANDVVIANDKVTSNTANNYSNAASAASDTTKSVKDTTKAIKKGSKLLDLYTLTFTEAASAADDIASTTKAGELEATVKPKLDLSLLSYGDDLGTFSFDALDIDEKTVKNIANSIKEITDSIAAFVDDVKVKGFKKAVQDLFDSLTDGRFSKVSEILGTIVDFVGNLIVYIADDPVRFLTDVAEAILLFKGTKWLLGGGLTTLSNNLNSLFNTDGIKNGKLASSIKGIAGAILSFAGGYGISEALSEFEETGNINIATLGGGIASSVSGIVLLTKAFGPLGTAASIALEIVGGVVQKVFELKENTKQLAKELTSPVFENKAEQYKTTESLISRLKEYNSEYEYLVQLEKGGSALSEQQLKRKEELAELIKETASEYDKLGSAATQASSDMWYLANASKGANLAISAINYIDDDSIAGKNTVASTLLSSILGKKTFKTIEEAGDNAPDALIEGLKKKGIDFYKEAQKYDAGLILAIRNSLASSSTYGKEFSGLSDDIQNILAVALATEFNAFSDDLETKYSDLFWVQAGLEAYKDTLKEYDIETEVVNGITYAVTTGIYSITDIVKDKELQDKLYEAGILTSDPIIKGISDNLGTGVQEAKEFLINGLKSVEATRKEITKYTFPVEESGSEYLKNVVSKTGSYGLDKNILTAGRDKFKQEASKTGEESTDSLVTSATSEFYSPENAAMIYDGWSELLSQGITSEAEAKEIGLNVASALVTGIDNGLSKALNKDGSIMTKLGKIRDALVDVPEAFRKSFESAADSVDRNMTRITSAMNTISSYKVTYSNPTNNVAGSKPQTFGEGILSGIKEGIGSLFSGSQREQQTQAPGITTYVNVKIGDREIRDFVVDVVTDNNNSVG